MTAGADWLQSIQNDDGGWGESLQSYCHTSCAACSPSTPSQTAWDLMDLLTVFPSDDEVVLAGITYLLHA
ncbi:squalene-hopene cyclase [Grosmannia clavigera kw1407]|uniref:Squalene-hopene cyclase n=1 Tax=Grosmannia clavigera (strain kw1407 / UAMH 11150) TaxID=655863 RepID=F0XI93_GROCL|nr:squalene-hopene cyclase [Grosmannia clavigera kw1407]EFX03216.1 squalene-hopene cyclase [Grosmannia clavigera kw1407]